MKMKVTFDYFVNAFEKSQYKDKFTQKGLKLLFDFIEQLDAMNNEETSLEDALLLCEEYEQNTVEKIIKTYSIDVGNANESERVSIVRAFLNDWTRIVGEAKGSFVYAKIRSTLCV